MGHRRLGSEGDRNLHSFIMIMMITIVVSYIYIYIHTHACMHTYMHACMHIYIYVYIHMIKWVIADSDPKAIGIPGDYCFSFLNIILFMYTLDNNVYIHKWVIADTNNDTSNL